MTLFAAKLKHLLNHDFFRLIGGSAYVFLFRITGAVSVYLTQVVIARWLGAEQLGIYVYAFSWLIMLAVLTGVGLPAACYRFLGHAIAHQKSGLARGYVKRSTQILSAVSVVVCLLVAVLIYQVPGIVDEHYRLAVVIGVLTAPILALISLKNSIAQAFSWIDISVIPHDAARPVGFLLLLLLCWQFVPGADIYSVLWIQFVAMVVTLVVVSSLLKRRINAKVAHETPEFQTRRWLRGASPLLIIMLVSGYFSEVNMIIAGSWLPPEDLAVFNAAFRTAFMVGFGITAVDAMSMPKAARMFASGEKDGLQRTLTHAAMLKSLGALVALVMFILWGKPVLGLFGAGFAVGHLPMIILGVAMMVIAGTGSVSELLSIGGHQDHPLYVFSAAFAVLLVLHAVLIPAYGLIGAASAVLITVLIYTSWLHWLVYSRMGVHPSLLGWFCSPAQKG